jgi:Ca2+ transporting ATPase
MITGDNILTAETIAMECGILDKNFQHSEDSFRTMEGHTFRKLVGGYEVIKNGSKEVTKIKNLDQFKLIAKDLRVLARASPEDKFLMVLGLLELENVVAVTGDGTNGISLSN